MRWLFAFGLTLASLQGANAGPFADSFAAVPVSDWYEMSAAQTVGVTQELAREGGHNGDIAIAICMRMIARDVRYKNRLMGEALSYCAKNWKEFDAKR